MQVLVKELKLQKLLEATSADIRRETEQRQDTEMWPVNLITVFGLWDKTRVP